MEFTETEKKLLTALHGAKLINWKFLPEFETFLKDYMNFEDLDLKKEVEKFVELGLLKIKDLGDGRVLCSHTDKVTSSMLDDELIYYGYDFSFENPR